MMELGGGGGTGGEWWMGGEVWSWRACGGRVGLGLGECGQCSSSRLATPVGCKKKARRLLLQQSGCPPNSNLIARSGGRRCSAADTKAEDDINLHGLQCQYCFSAAC
jgi:hypothetical protein